MAQQPKRPDKTLKLPESGLEITMTYMVFNDILRFVGTLEEAMQSLLVNQETRDLVLRRLLTKSEKPVEDVKDLIPVEEMNIDIFEMNDALGWTMEHIAYFFMKTATTMQDRVAKFPEFARKTMTSSDPSPSGSEA